MDSSRECSTTQPITGHGIARGRVTRYVRTADSLQDVPLTLKMGHEVFLHEEVLDNAHIASGYLRINPLFN
jgi:hypothetical protein